MIEKYQDMARAGDTRPSRFVSSAAVILYFYVFIGAFISGIPMLIMIFTNRQAMADATIASDVNSFLTRYIGTLPIYILTNLTIFCMLLGLVIGVKFIHYRSITSLITTRPKMQWSRFWTGFAVYGILILIGSAVDYFMSPETYSFSFDASKFWLALPFILIMTPIQTTTEELVFRGYLIQSFGLKVRNAMLLSLISGVLFTLPHLANPEVYASNKLGVISSVCMILNYFVVGASFALITIKTNSLEIAMGAHAVNNLICALLLGYPDSALATNTVFMTSSFEPVSGLVSVIVVSVLFYYISAFLARKNRGE